MFDLINILLLNILLMNIHKYVCILNCVYMYLKHIDFTIVDKKVKVVCP